MGSEFEPDTTYIVDVNGVTREFEVQGGNNSPDIPDVGTAILDDPFQHGTDWDMAEVLAPIDNLEINIAESFPPKVSLNVQSGLPNGCVEFSRYELERDGASIRVTIWNLEPTDPNIACTEQYRTVDTNIGLGSEFEPNTTYVVDVNGVTRECRVSAQLDTIEA